MYMWTSELGKHLEVQSLPENPIDKYEVHLKLVMEQQLGIWKK